MVGTEVLKGADRRPTPNSEVARLNKQLDNLKGHLARLPEGTRTVQIISKVRGGCG